MTTLEQRFWAKVRKTDGCWFWEGSRSSDGYGNIRVGRRVIGVHRIAYELLVGLIPDGLTIDHLCRNRACVNPAHMEPVSNAINVLRGDGPPAQNARATHCVHGHLFDILNTLVLTGGRRMCRTCNKLRLHAARQHG